MVLDGSKQFGLQFERHLSDFIEEERALMRQFESSDPLPRRTRECAFFMAERLAFQKAGGDCSAVDFHKTALAPMA
jgi:hypothetical protein